MWSIQLSLNKQARQELNGNKHITPSIFSLTPLLKLTWQGTSVRWIFSRWRRGRGERSVSQLFLAACPGECMSCHNGSSRQIPHISSALLSLAKESNYTHRVESPKPTLGLFYSLDSALLALLLLSHYIPIPASPQNIVNFQFRN